jgi:hypothetical protein
VLTNPHTGEPRDYRDVNLDPQGLAIVKDGEPLRAYTPLSASEASEEWKAATTVANHDDVDDVLRDFAEDPTGDNGVMVVREVMRVLRLSPPTPSAGVSEAHHYVMDEEARDYECCQKCGHVRERVVCAALAAAEGVK